MKAPEAPLKAPDESNRPRRNPCVVLDLMIGKDGGDPNDEKGSFLGGHSG
jgi:hypothetical protein